MSLSYIRSQKSWKLVKGPFSSRSRTMLWIKLRPMPFTAARPKRMPPSSTVKLSRERFTSGGRRAMPSSGCIVYQEQVMQIFQQLAGYSLGQAPAPT